MSGIETAGYEAGKDVAIALDPAASELYGRVYTFKKSVRAPSLGGDDRAVQELDRSLPIVSIEDGWRGRLGRLGQAHGGLASGCSWWVTTFSVPTDLLSRASRRRGECHFD